MKSPITFEQLPELVGTILESLERIERKLTDQSQNSISLDSNKALTVKEAAEFLDLAIPTIYTMVSKGLLPYNKKSKRIYFFKQELLDYLHSGRKRTVEEIASDASQYVSFKKAG